ncbi:hypothetical protein FRC09_007342 [Ceratobasidium sp. 395]|nr:hypothetical protein FRC09_007342 [Ceratobasidium sp. 395]
MCESNWVDRIELNGIEWNGIESSAAGEPKLFDGDAFLDDIGFGIARALAITGEGPSGSGTRVSARTPPPRVDMPPATRSSPPEARTPPSTTRTPPPKTHTPSPAKTDTPPPAMRSPTPPAARTPTSPPATRPAPAQSSPAVRPPAMRPNPSLPAMRPPRMSSPLARLSTAPPARPISPAPRTGVSDYSGVGRTRRRVRPMGTSVVGGGDDEEPGDTESVVGWDYEESVVGGGESVVGGGAQSVAGGRGSIVSGREQSAVGGRSGRGASVAGSVVGGRDESVVGWGRLESVIGAREESVIGGKGASVVSGRTRSVVSGKQESVGGKGTSIARGSSGRTDVGSSKRDSILSSLPAGLVVMASSDEEDSIISPIQPKSIVSKTRATAATTQGESTETHVDEFGATRPQASSVVGSTASATALRRRVRGQSVLSTSESEAPSSVVSPLSPRLISVLQASGMHVDPERGPTSDELDAVIGRMAGMDIAAQPTQEVQELPMTIERVDTDSGITSPIVPPGAPSDAGSLFSRVVSPKPPPAKLRLGAVRMSATSTPSKSTTPAQNTSSRAAHPQVRPNSSLSAAARVPAPASVGSTQPPAPEVRPESLFSSGTNLRRSADPTQMPMPRGRSVFSRGPRSVTSAVSGASQEPTGLMSRLQAAGSRPKKLMATRITNPTAQKGKGKTPASASAPSDDFDGGLTSSEEESGDDEDEDSDTKTAAGEDDGLDHLTESVDEAGSLQPQESPVVERPAKRVTSPHAMPSEPIDQSLSISPQLMPSADPAVIESLEREMMPDEVLSLNPVICDACYAPMPLAKWTEHISKSGHRRNAARYSQLIMEQSTHGTPTPPLNDARERWAEATRIQPRRAHPSEYAFCDVCAVFLLRGDVEHFQGKKHYRCVRAAALNDADELESVRGSVSDEEDGPSARAFRGAAAANGSLGQQAFQGAGVAEQVTWNGV